MWLSMGNGCGSGFRGSIHDGADRLMSAGAPDERIARLARPETHMGMLQRGRVRTVDSE